MFLGIKKKSWWWITTIKSKFYNHLFKNQSDRNVKKYRPNRQSNQYNFSGKRQNGFGYGIPVIITGITKINNQLLRPIQYFISYQFQNLVIFRFLFFGYPNIFYQ